MGRLGHRWRDLVLVALGLAMGVLTLAYPFGHDQGVHFYVGREWALHGAIPYRDTFDYKTPGVFVLYALLVRVFGQGMWTIRLADLTCTLALGLVCAKLVEGRARASGFVGFVCLTTFVFYYGYFTFWDTAQCEIWATTFALASVLASRSATVARAFGAGVLAAFSGLMKPPAILLVAPALWNLSRAPRSRVAFAAFAAGVAAPVALTLGYFGAHGALGAMFDILFGADAQYVIGMRRVHSWSDLYVEVVDVITWFHPFGAIFVVLTIVALIRRSPLPRMPVMLVGLALLAIAVQLKFYRYHWGLLVGPLAICVATVQRRWVPDRPMVSALAILALYGISGPPSRNWRFDQGAAFDYVTGKIGRRAFAAHFAIPSVGYNEGESEDAARWVRAHTTDDELVLVRDFQPEVYALAHRRAPSRFFWTSALTDPNRTYHRAEWLDEDERAVATLPRVVVTVTDARPGADAVERFTRLGYTRCHQSGKLLVLTQPKLEACEL